MDSATIGLIAYLTFFLILFVAVIWFLRAQDKALADTIKAIKEWETKHGQ